MHAPPDIGSVEVFRDVLRLADGRGMQTVLRGDRDDVAFNELDTFTRIENSRFSQAIIFLAGPAADLNGR